MENVNLDIDRLAELVANRVVALLADQSQYVSREEYASRTSLSPKTVDRMVKAGKLQVRREGRRVLIYIGSAHESLR